MEAYEYEALMEVIEAKIELMIADALGRDSLSETCAFHRIEERFRREYLEGANK
jgi:hypothetical protein